MEVVRTADLHRVVVEFMDLHSLEHPFIGTGGDHKLSRKSNVAVLGPREYILQRSGVSYKKLKAVIDGSTEWTDFGTADAILCAIDKPHLFHSEVPIHDRP